MNEAHRDSQLILRRRRRVIVRLLPEEDGPADVVQRHAVDEVLEVGRCVAQLDGAGEVGCDREGLRARLILRSYGGGRMEDCKYLLVRYFFSRPNLYIY